MAIIGAFTQAPKHSTSDIVNNLSFVVSPTLIPSFCYLWKRPNETIFRKKFLTNVIDRIFPISTYSASIKHDIRVS